MVLTINGQPQTVPDGATVTQLLEGRDLQGSPCAVEVNESLVPRRMHADHLLSDGDRVEIVTLVGGG